MISFSNSLSRRTSLGILLGTSLILAVIFLFLRQIPLGADYHVFADSRPLFGIPNCLDVLSNVPLIPVGAAGVLFTLRSRRAESFVENRERIPYVIFFLGVLLNGISSSYYHAAPGNFRLIWDLLPMAISFVSFTDATIVERISPRLGMYLLTPLLLLGVTSVAYWYQGQTQGDGDLRFYLFVQFVPPVAVGLMMALFPPRYTRTADLFVAFSFLALAKICQQFDKQIFSLGELISGHSLKHLFTAISCYWILRMLQLRRPATIALIGHDLA